MLPLPDTSIQRPQKLAIVGALLASCICEKRLISVDALPPAFFKFLLGAEKAIDMRDLDVYDPSLCRGLRALALEKNVEDLCLDFSAAGLLSYT